MDRKKENILHQLKKSGPGFTVPSAYFKEGEFKESSDDFKQNSHSEENSFFILDKVIKTPGFKVPKDYFELAESNIYNAKKPKLIRLKPAIIKVISLSIAASILLFFGINYMNPSQNINEDLVFQDEEFVNWIESDMVDFDSYEIAEAFSDIELEHDLYAEEDIDEYLNTVDIENLILENR